MTSKEALINLKLECSVKGKLSKFQQICFECLEKELENPSLSECIKEWEERGWIRSESTTGLCFFKYDKEKKSNIFLIFNLKNKTFYADFNIDLKTSELIHKTLKSLEGMKDE